MEERNDKSSVMNPIETREVRGMTIKNIWTIITSTVTILFFVWRMTDNILQRTEEINRRVSALEVARPSEKEYSEYRLKTIETNLGILQVQLETLRNQVTQNSRELGFESKKNQQN